MILVNSYKDYDGNVVKIGDRIAKVDISTGETGEIMGKVIKIRKQGFFVHPETAFCVRRDELWGKFTRKFPGKNK